MSLKLPLLAVTLLQTSLVVNSIGADCMAAVTKIQMQDPPCMPSDENGLDPDRMCSSTCAPLLEEMGEACKAEAEDGGVGAQMTMMAQLCSDNCLLGFLTIGSKKECAMDGMPSEELACGEDCKSAFCGIGHDCDPENMPELFKQQGMEQQQWSMSIGLMKGATANCEPACDAPPPAAEPSTDEGYRQIHISPFFHLATVALVTLAYA
eukprot:gnl/TRDRNA2_/TRDRNA2_31530_c0_seq1.p1 gnl/TRDRNA2_/TRDRNA2_31530_c0~~gnl/TRDRNA2_/TRDRNA2_31530_c0_seq1.p1  ORF type:complete len:208 (-),score=35.37 gnl/TRDRNA2_/TRDRNA2_31530_c0_seq1:84-707(-)